MKHSIIRLLAVTIALILLMGLVGCNKNKEPQVSTPDAVDTSTSDSAEQTTTTTEAKSQFFLNPYTGVEDLTSENSRPVGLVVTDESSSVTQLNLEAADFYFEAETEGGIPRILAVFASADRVPDVIGPVRSARTHFVKVAKALDIIYCHIGGSKGGRDTIKELGVDDLGNEYEINEILKNSDNVSWNRSAFTKAKVTAAIKNKGYRTTTSVASPYVFGEKEGTMAAATVDVQISESYHMAFTYVEETGLYQKHRNKLSSAVHTTHTGGTIEVSNVIVMFDHRYVEQVENKSDGGQLIRYDFTLESGSGYLACGGTAREIKWKRTNDQLSFFEADGTTPLTVATGKTFVCLASDTLKSKTKIY